MSRQPMTPQTEPVGTDGLTFRERTWLEAARQHVAELNQLLSERGSTARYTVGVAGLEPVGEPMSTPADELRAAATKLRARIDNLGYPDGSEPWSVRPGSGPDFPAVTATAHDGEVITIAEGAWLSTAVFITTMHPGVGAALADWLDTAAANAAVLTWPNDFIERALAVARAINGSPR